MTRQNVDKNEVEQDNASFLFPIRNGLVENIGDQKKMRPEHKKIIEQVVQYYAQHLEEELVAIYIRGSVSSGRTSRYSDFDSVAVTKSDLADSRKKWAKQVSELLLKKYPELNFFELDIVSKDELLKSDNFANLRINLLSQSVCVYGKNIMLESSPLQINATTAKTMADIVFADLDTLEKIFSGEINDPRYLYKKRPTKFWCVWLCRTIIRSAVGLLMLDTPVFTRDMVWIAKEFSDKFPEYKDDFSQLLEWSINPISSKSVLLNFVQSFREKYHQTWNINTR